MNPLHRHDERALALIDACLRSGNFPPEVVAQISYALTQAEQVEREAQRPYVPRESRR